MGQQTWIQVIDWTIRHLSITYLTFPSELVMLRIQFLCWNAQAWAYSCQPWCRGADVLLMVPGHDEQPPQRGIHEWVAKHCQAPRVLRRPTSAASVTLTSEGSFRLSWRGAAPGKCGWALTSTGDATCETRVLHSSGSPAERFLRKSAEEQRTTIYRQTWAGAAEEAGSASLTRSRAQVHDSWRFLHHIAQWNDWLGRSSSRASVTGKYRRCIWEVVSASGKLAGSTGQLGPRTNKSSNASLTWTSNLCISWLNLSRNLKAATRRGPTTAAMTLRKRGWYLMVCSSLSKVSDHALPEALPEVQAKLQQQRLVGGSSSGGSRATKELDCWTPLSHSGSLTGAAPTECKVKIPEAAKPHIAVRLTPEIWLPLEPSWQRYFSMCRASYQWVTCWSSMFAQFHRLENTLRCESLTCSTWWMKIHPKSTLSVTFQQSLSGIRLKRYIVSFLKSCTWQWRPTRLCPLETWKPCRTGQQTAETQHQTDGTTMGKKAGQNLQFWWFIT